MRRYFIVLLLFIPALASLAAGYIWQPIGIDQGLPDPNVTALAKSEDGRLFIGTAIGLFSYDGYTFEKINLGDQGRLNPYINTLLITGNHLYIGLREAVISLSLSDHSLLTIPKPLNALGGVIDFYPDPPKDKLFVLTNSGILILDIRSGRFEKSDSISYSRFRRLRIVNDREIHAFTFDHTFVKVRNKVVQTVFTDRQILEAAWWEKENGWLVVKADGIYLLDGGFRSLVKMKVDQKLNSNENRWLYPDKNGGFWVQVSGGFVFLPQSKIQNPEFFSHETGNPFSITSSTAQAFLTEPGGTQWVGGDGSGLSYLRNSGRAFTYLTNEEAQVQHFWCFRHEPASGRLWCGTTHGILACRFSNGALSEERLLHPAGFSRFSVNAIADLNDNEFILSVYKEGFWALDKKTLRFRRLDAVNRTIGVNFVYGIIPVSGGRLALLSQLNTWMLDKITLQVQPIKQVAFRNFSIFTLLEDSKHQILMAGGFGLQVFNARLELQRYFARSDSANSLSSNVIMDIRELSGNRYLLATMGGGLCEFDQNTSTFRRISLVTDPMNVFGIMKVNQDEVLLTTSGGLCQYNLKTGQSSILNKSNGLPFNDFNQNAFLLDDTWCFTGGEKGMLALRSDQISSLFRDQNRILVRNNGTIVNTLELAPGSHSLNLSLSLKDIVPASRLRFAYRINGLDTSWQILPYGQNALVYSYIPPGNYTIEVKIVDNTGVIHAGISTVKLAVIPYFYQTTWFFILTGLLITAIIFILVRYFALIRLRWKLNRLDAERKVMYERARISRELHDNLGSQLTYLISGLETTGLFLSRNNLQKTTQNLEKMQSAARESIQQLRDSIWALKPGNMTLHSLSQECERWITRITEAREDLHSSFNMEHCPDFTIDPMHGLNVYRIVQEAVHNSVKHSSASQLEVFFRCDDDKVTIEICDNGKGISESVSGGNGMASMKQRAEELKAEIQIGNKPEGGAFVIVTLDKNTLKG